jgi:hypothetical protein
MHVHVQNCEGETGDWCKGTKDIRMINRVETIKLTEMESRKIEKMQKK